MTSPNEHSAAVPAAQRAGLLDKTDPTKFSAEALNDPASYVRNFAHEVAGHQASLDEAAEESAEALAPFANEEAVVLALQSVVARAKSQGYIVQAVESGLIHALEGFHVEKA